jgi:hypothetical protein
VDQRRKELGLPPLAEYLKMVNTKPGEPGKLPNPKTGPSK